jgi:hypothetical protein
MSWFDRWRRPDDAADSDDRALLERARALPRRAEPERDLWAGIRNRIELAAEAEPAAPAGWRAGFRVPLWAASAVLLLLIATSVGTGLWLSAPALSLDDPEAVRALADSLRDRDGTGQVRHNLLALLEERREQLPPEVVASLEQNLAEIDRAIAEIHLAFEEHPESPALQFLLAQAYRSEAEILEQLEWWTRTREEARS